MAKRLAKVNRNDCVACGVCVKVCPKAAISIFKGLFASIEESKCVGCGICLKSCPGSVIDLMEVKQ